MKIEKTFLKEGEIRKLDTYYLLLKHGILWCIYYDHEDGIKADVAINRAFEKGEQCTLYELWKICTDLKKCQYFNLIPWEK